MIQIFLDVGDKTVLWGVFGDQVIPLQGIPPELADLLVGISVARSENDRPRLIRLGLIAAYARLAHVTAAEDVRIPSGGTIVPPEGTPPGAFIVATYLPGGDPELIDRGEEVAARAGIVISDEDIALSIHAGELLKAFSIQPRTPPSAAPDQAAKPETPAEPKRRGRPRKSDRVLTGAERARMYRQRRRADGARLVQVSVPSEHVSLVRTLAAALRDPDRDLTDRLLRLVT